MDGIRVASVTGATGTHAVAERPNPLEIESVERAGQQALADANVTQDDVDVACIHDAFTILELLELEELGFTTPATPGGRRRTAKRPSTDGCRSTPVADSRPAAIRSARPASHR